MEYDELVLHFRPQPYYKEAEAFQVAVRRSTVSHLGGAWLRRGAGPTDAKDRLTLAWVQGMRERYRRYVERYWQVAQEEEAAFMGSSATISQQEVATFGREMFEALPWSVQEAIVVALRRARSGGQSLRLVLQFEGEGEAIRQVGGLPWELLHVPALDHFLALSGPVSLVRGLPEAGLAGPPEPSTPRQVLAVVANPRGLAVPLDDELVALEQTAASSGDRLALETLSGPDTLGRLRRRLAEGDVDGLILIAHGDLSQGWGQGFLLLEDEAGNSRRVDSRFLRPLFSDTALQFVVLAACHSGEGEPAAAPTSAPSEGVPLGEWLARDGVPAVVAMQDRMGIRANRQFLGALLGELAAGRPLEEGVRQGRKAVYQSGLDPIQWSVPALYRLVEAGPSLAWYARLADGLADWFWQPGAEPAIAGLLSVALIWTLINVVTGLGATRAWPPLDWAPAGWWALLVWLVLSPFLIAALHRPGHPRVQELSPRQRWAYKVQGANVGMLVGSFSALLGLSLVYCSPLWPLLPGAARELTLALGLGWAALMTYAQVRAIPRVMTVNAHVEKPRLTGNDLFVVVFWPVMWVGLVVMGEMINWLIPGLWARPAVVSIFSAVILLALVVLLRRGNRGQPG